MERDSEKLGRKKAAEARGTRSAYKCLAQRKEGVVVVVIVIVVVVVVVVIVIIIYIVVR